MIYLDNNATTRVAPEVLDAMQPYLGRVFRQSFFGARAWSRDEARGRAGARTSREFDRRRRASEIVFTSCGSESDNWAIRGLLATQPQKKHIVTTLVEHEAVRNLCRLLENEGYEVSWLEVDHNGELDLDELRAALRPDTALVSMMLANNETGVLFPIEEIGRIVRERFRRGVSCRRCAGGGQGSDRFEEHGSRSVCAFGSQAARAAGHRRALHSERHFFVAVDRRRRTGTGSSRRHFGGSEHRRTRRRLPPGAGRRRSRSNRAPAKSS